jgi:hypothetical protein
MNTFHSINNGITIFSDFYDSETWQNQAGCGAGLGALDSAAVKVSGFRGAGMPMLLKK